MAPGTSQPEVSEAEHGGDFGGEFPSESFVAVESQSASKLKPSRWCPFVLQIERLRIVVGRTAFNAGRCLEIVVFHFHSCREPLLVRQVEHTLQVCHDPLLIALQRFLPLEVREVEDECAVFVESFSQGGGGEGMVVGVFVPVHIKCDAVSFACGPASSC